MCVLRVCVHICVNVCVFMYVVCIYVCIGAGCFSAGDAVPLLSSSNNQTTVEEELTKFSCSFNGSYTPINYSVYWIIKFQNGSTIEVKNDSIPGYHVNTKVNCPLTDSSCCNFTTELIIHAILLLNNAMITCNAIFVDSLIPTSSSSYLSELSVISIPIRCLELFSDHALMMFS